MMSEFQHKYIKYKKKYLTLKLYGGFRHHQILLDGVSSSGKTTIAKFFVENGYEHIDSDDTDIAALQHDVGQIINVNKYYTLNEMRAIGERLKTLQMYNRGQNKDVVYDDIFQHILQHFPNKNDLFVIVVYASLETLTRNILSRRMSAHPRGPNVFRQFSEKYIVTDTKGIDVVNRGKFRHLLKSKLKYLFESEKDLDNFVDRTFATMNIFDDDNHQIKIRDEFKCDYLLNTTGKTPEQLFDELRQFTM